MKNLVMSTISLCLLALLGCGRPVHYRFHPYHEVGKTLPIEVGVDYKPDDYVSGTVYHRTGGRGVYEATPMRLRGHQLWAVLPTDHLQSQEAVEYYIDVTKGDKLYTLGTPGSPFVATFLDEVGMLLASLRDHPVASDDHHPVEIVLVTNHRVVDQPIAIYQMPAVPGDIRAPMLTDARGNYRLQIPEYAVHAGTWRYAIEVPFNGETYRLPRHGYRSFVVTPASYSHPATKTTADASP